MSESKRFIGIDIGAASGRCVVGSLRNGSISLDEVYRFTTPTITLNEELYWDISNIVNEMITGISKASEKYGGKIDSIGIDTWGVDYVLIDKKGSLVGNPHHYRDHRTDNIMEDALRIIKQEDIYEITGNTLAQYNTLFQLLAEKKNFPDHLRMDYKMVLIPDYLKYVLTGKLYAEYTIASTTNLVDAVNKDWSKYLLDLFEFPRTLFPEIINPGEVLGYLLPDISKQTGLSNKTPVISTPGHDTACAVAAIPGLTDNWAFLSSGTWSLFGLEIESPLINNKTSKYGFSNEGGFGNTIRLLKNITGLWALQECKKNWSSDKGSLNYTKLISEANEYGFAEAWINLDDDRFLKPSSMPETIRAYLQDTKQKYVDDIGFITRVILESLAFNYRKATNNLVETTGKAIHKLHVVGGGSNNKLLNQLTADATGLYLITGPVEGTITGNIGIQAIATGAVKDIHEWRKIVENSFDLDEYEPEQRNYFTENESLYNSLCA